MSKAPAYTLTEAEKRDLTHLIEQGRPLPEKYRFVLFEDKREVELVWNGKSRDVCTTVLPFQTLEHVDEPRKETKSQAALFDARGRQTGGWTNKLIWGDNKLILASLKAGPLRRQIEEAGGLKLIYIDPPFDVGADFSLDIEIGGETFHKEPNLLEQIAYRDTWGRGADSFIAMIYERLILMRDLLASDGSIYVHCDWRVNSYMRLALDEVFGRDRFKNQITWQRFNFHADARRYGIVVDEILFFTKGDALAWNPQMVPIKDSYVASHFRTADADGRKYKMADILAKGAGPARRFGDRVLEPPSGTHWRFGQEKIDELMALRKIEFTKNGRPAVKMYLDEKDGSAVHCLWTDIPPVNPMAEERRDYPTQKPEALLERILKASSNEGDLVADFFCGSGTTAAVAEKLGRKWIATDLGKFGIHTTRKRLIGVQRELQAADKNFRAFEVLNLGRYERQAYLDAHFTLDPRHSRAGGISNSHSREGGNPGGFAAGAVTKDGNVNLDSRLRGNDKPELSREQMRQQILMQKEREFRELILRAYKAEALPDMAFFHGRHAGRLVVIGPINLPVGRLFVEEVITECRKRGASRVDVLAFEFEMGLFPAVLDEAKSKGIELAPKYIPAEVFDKRAVDKGQVVFHDISFVEARAVYDKKNKLRLQIELTDFSVFYSQGVLDAALADLKEGKSQVVLDKGALVKIAKSKEGFISRETLTKQWTDWVDYWAVDFDYQSRKEIVKLPKTDGVGTALTGFELPQGELKLPEFEERWTGGFIFENEWQSFRTRQSRALELITAEHSYEKPGRYTVAIKVIDIFGNDTMTLVPVVVG